MVFVCAAQGCELMDEVALASPNRASDVTILEAKRKDGLVSVSDTPSYGKNYGEIRNKFGR